MAGLSSFYALLLLAIVARIAAQLGPVDPEFEEFFIEVPSATKFQLSILEANKVENYLYADGRKVLKTSDPVSVGRKAIWEAVDGDYIVGVDGAFGIKNSGNGFTLLYDGEFYTQELEASPIAGWRISVSSAQVYPTQYSLFYLPYSSNRIPGIFYYKPTASSAARIPHQLRHSRSAARTRGVRVGPNIDPFSPIVEVPVGTKFQLAIFKDGEEHYLYSEGEKVKTTTNPDSVGTKRTIWESVNAIAPLELSLPYINAFAIKNIDTGFALLYNGEFYGAYSEEIALAGWKLYLSPLRIYYLAYLPYSNGNAIPGVFYYKPLVEAIQTVVA